MLPQPLPLPQKKQQPPSPHLAPLPQPQHPLHQERCQMGQQPVHQPPPQHGQQEQHMKQQEESPFVRHSRDTSKPHAVRIEPEVVVRADGTAFSLPGATAHVRPGVVLLEADFSAEYDAYAETVLGGALHTLAKKYGMRDGELVQGRLKSLSRIRDNAKLCDEPLIIELWNMLKSRFYRALLARGEHPDRHCFDAFSLLFGYGPFGQLIHFDDQRARMGLYYPYPTTPTRAQREQRGSVDYYLKLMDSQYSGASELAKSLMREWSPDEINNIFTALASVAYDTPPIDWPLSGDGQREITVVRGTSAMLLDPLHGHGASFPDQVPQRPDWMRWTPGEPRVTVFVTCVDVHPFLQDQYKRGGGFMGQQLHGGVDFRAYTYNPDQQLMPLVSQYLIGAFDRFLYFLRTFNSVEGDEPFVFLGDRNSRDTQALRTYRTLCHDTKATTEQIEKAAANVKKYWFTEPRRLHDVYPEMLVPRGAARFSMEPAPTDAPHNDHRHDRRKRPRSGAK